MPFSVTEVPPGKETKWTTEELSVRKGQLTHLVLTSIYGTLEVGLRSDGYAGWAFRETGGAGSVTLPYSFTPEGELIVGLLPERRGNMGDQEQFCIVGGFKKPNETHDQAAAREASGEAGLGGLKSTELPGYAINPNRAFFVANSLEQEGLHVYAIRVPFDWLGHTEGLALAFKKLPEQTAADLGKAVSVRFFPWKVAVGVTADGIALAAIARLVAQVL